MFRNPRENADRALTEALLPSTGRPPTPPNGASPYFAMPTPMAVATTPAPVRTPVIGRQPSRPAPTTKKHNKPNQSILNFFVKADRTEDAGVGGNANDSLFFDDRKGRSPSTSSRKQEFSVSNGHEDDLHSRFNESGTPSKRPRLSGYDEETFARTPSPELSQRSQLNDVPSLALKANNAPKMRGGFLDDSDDDEDVTNWSAALPEEDDGVIVGESQHENQAVQISSTTEKVPLKPPDLGADEPTDHNNHERNDSSGTVVPSLIREGTSMYNADDFGDDENFEDEFFEEGEEYMERRWMQEQAEMEIGLDEDSKSESGTDSIRTPQSNLEDGATMGDISAEVQTCPLCNESLKGLTEAQASSHVNACLDGNAPPLPVRPKEEPEPASTKPPPAPINGVTGHKRFQRAAIARPAQQNPFAMSKDTKKDQSAFTRLMSGHAEDAAWAEAAANEKDSRGRPAYQRTCPFYKIMPGFYICVDAFRYGKVEGQNAYFLSHFHSDHYIGLTSSWAHGPIYASKVTCNLMRAVLKVDPKWLVPLEFEQKIEVPNTKGVFVTMIPANHCPGSSLYLFEKVIGKNKDGSERMTRVLHCGDFRACPAHISHPLLRPDVLDSITGQTRQQVIDTCYLDTTYLTPKYSFPGQHDVIDACAQMCISLSKEIADTSDSWEQAKASRMGSTMSKFLEKGDAELIKPEEDDTKPRMRGRLLVVIGTYSIGKERICLGIAKALGSKIFAPPAKMRICKCLEDPELNAVLTSNPLEAQVHMQTLMEIRAETLHDYLVGFKPHFARIVGFRPTGWSYRPPTSRFTENPAVSTVLHSDGWKSEFTMRDLAPQRGSTKESNCFGVPYSEHSSFRELTMFCCALRIKRVVPTVNVGSAKSREKMKGWIEKWEVEKKRNGLYVVEAGAEGWGSGDGGLRYGV
jgi:DNA cross-link repair 1A protein